MNNLKTNKSQTTHLQHIIKYTDYRQSGNKCNAGAFSK
jgi:hypothetical protein